MDDAQRQYITLALGLLASATDSTDTDASFSANAEENAKIKAAVAPLLETWVLPVLLAALNPENSDIRDCVETLHQSNVDAGRAWATKAFGDGPAAAIHL